MSTNRSWKFNHLLTQNNNQKLYDKQKTLTKFIQTLSPILTDSVLFLASSFDNLCLEVEMDELVTGREASPGRDASKLKKAT